MPDYPLCKDCQHFDGRAYCTRTTRAPDYVFGKHPGHVSAQSEREWELTDACGPKGIHFAHIAARAPSSVTPEDKPPF